MTRRFAGVLAIVILIATARVRADSAQFIPLGDLPGGAFYSYAQGISADGTVVVGKSSSAIGGDGTEAFRWTVGGGMIAMGTISANPSNTFFGGAVAASADGSVIVGNTPDPFIWTSGGGMLDIRDLSTTGFTIRVILDVSADGSVVVGYGSNPVTQSAFEGFRWTADAGALGIGGLSQVVVDSFASGVSADGNVLGGQSMSGPPDVQPIRWTQSGGLEGLGGLTLLTGDFVYGLGWGISADGSTVVGEARTENFEEAFMWRAEMGMVSLDPDRGTTFFSIAEDTSADGAIIVGSMSGDPVRDGAMIWDTAHGIRSLQDILENEHGLDLTGWQLRSARAVSDDGTRIAGWGMNPNGDTEGWLVILPPYCTRACGNVDGIGDVVDGADFTSFAACLDAGTTLSPTCICADLNDDGAVNLFDYARFMRLFDQQAVGATPACTP